MNRTRFIIFKVFSTTDEKVIAQGPVFKYGTAGFVA
jgi:hypothetical protein